MRAELVFIGTELLLGEILNTHAVTLARSLADEGIDVYRMVTVGDNLERATAAVRQALERADLVVCTGGLGPTEDDVTREAVAAATGRALREDPGSLAAVRAYLERRGIPLTPGNARQATLPEGAEPLPNANGTAPGIFLRHGERLVVCLPGPPSELAPMWRDEVLPRLRAERARRGEAPSRLYRRVLRVVGLPESLLEERLHDLVHGQTDPTIAPYAKPGFEVHLRLATKATSEEEALGRLQPLEEEILRRIGPHVYGRDDETLEAAVGGLLQRHGLRLVVAESCTGGLIGHMLTNVPGSSAYVLGSLVCYDNRLKQSLLAVPETTLAAHGAVSAETARAMAAGALAATGADVALAVTGIAGPSGGTPAKPVGTVWFCVMDRRRELTRHFLVRGGREQVKSRAAGIGLALIRGFVLGLPDGGVH